MKKTKTLWFILLLMLISSVTALISCRKYLYYEEPPPVDLVCELNIRGGCLDQWQMVNDGFDNYCFEPVGGFLRTLNYLTTIPGAAGGPGPQTTDSTPDSYSGDYAALLTTSSFMVQGSPVLIPGLVGTDSLDIPNATILLGKPYTEKPLKFKGFYKYQPVGGDSAMVLIILSKYNPGAHKRDTIAYARQVFKNTVSNYSLIDLPLDYYINNLMPDSLRLIICSSAGVNFNDLVNCKGQVGSKMWIDEIEFIMP